MLLADRRDYKRGYEKHFEAYRSMAEKNQSAKSRCLLLIYSVECGLKYKLMIHWHENSTKGWIDDKNDKRSELIKNHNIESMLKELNQCGTFHFPSLKTVHNQGVSAKTYHQFCRYGIEAKDKDGLNEKQYEKVLLQVAEWIGEEIGL